MSTARIYYRRALMDGPLEDGASLEGGDLSDDCTQWSAAVEIPTAYDAAGLSIVFEEGAYVLAYRNGQPAAAVPGVRGSWGPLYTYGALLGHH